METTPYRYCGVCGQPLQPGATVCGNCGAAVEGATGAGAAGAGAAGAAGADDTGAGPATGDSTMAMPAADASQCVDATIPKVPRSSGRVEKLIPQR